MSKIDQIINEQVLSWAQRESKTSYKEDPEEWPVITISREYGASGRSLARVLGKRMGFKVWDKEILTSIVEEAGGDERFLATLDERRRKTIDDFMYSFFMGSKHSNTHYFRSLLKVVHTIGAHGKGIIVGRGANFIIKSPAVLRVRLVRPIEERISYVAERERISVKEAEKLVKTRDAERDDFIRHHFKQDAGHALNYDMVLNSGIFGIDHLADLVMVAYEKKVGKVVSASV